MNTTGNFKKKIKKIKNLIKKTKRKKIITHIHAPPKS